MALSSKGYARRNLNGGLLSRSPRFGLDIYTSKEYIVRYANSRRNASFPAAVASLLE